MHEPVAGRVEEYLQGAAPELDEHLAQCPSCRKEIADMQSVAALLRGLKPSDEVDPAGGFYARVLNRIETQSRQSAWTVFSETLFARRLALASVSFVVLLGTYLVSTTQTQQQPYTASAPEVLIANDDHVHPAISDNVQADRDTVLVSLASYQQ